MSSLEKITLGVILGCCSPWIQFMFCIYNKGQMSLQFPAEISVGLVLTSQSHSLEEGHYKEARRREMSHHRESQE